LVLPIGYAIYQSFLGQHSNSLGLGVTTTRFVGLRKYWDAITSPDFGAGMKRVALFGLINIPLTIGLALIFALILDISAIPCRGLFRIIYFLPYAIPGVVGGILWAFLYQPQLSPYSDVLHAIGAGKVDLLSPNLVIWSIANIVIWEFAGYNMLILTASLNAIPSEQYEAARIDGAGRLREAIYIKIPQLRPALVMTVLFAIIGTLQLFNEPLVLSLVTKSVTTTYTPNFMSYTEAFNNDNYYFASAISVILALITAVCSFVFLTVVNRRAQR
jgi:multiple sugar transport system permease protein